MGESEWARARKKRKVRKRFALCTISILSKPFKDAIVMMQYRSMLVATFDFVICFDSLCHLLSARYTQSTRNLWDENDDIMLKRIEIMIFLFFKCIFFLIINHLKFESLENLLFSSLFFSICRSIVHRNRQQFQHFENVCVVQSVRRQGFGVFDLYLNTFFCWFGNVSIGS